MNIADVLLGSMVFATAGAGSLQLTAQMGQSLLEQRRDAERMEQIDLALLMGEQALRRAAELRPVPDPACADPSTLLVQLLEQTPALTLPTGWQRKLSVRHDRQVSLEVLGGDSYLVRRRVFTPASYGLCSAP